MYLLDTANIEQIKSLNSSLCIGVTTNPSIVVKEKSNYTELINGLNNTLRKDQLLFIQLTETTTDKMVEEALLLQSIVGDKFVAKIAFSDEGLEAARILLDKGIKVITTAICSLNQAIASALVGVHGIAVYVNRIDDSGRSSEEVLKGIRLMYDRMNSKTLVIGASFKSVTQVNKSLLAGCDQVTLPVNIYEKIFTSEITDYSIDQFHSQFTEEYNSLGINLLKKGK